jgi:hypothetical protein
MIVFYSILIFNIAPTLPALPRGRKGVLKINLHPLGSGANKLIFLHKEITTYKFK